MRTTSENNPFVSQAAKRSGEYSTHYPLKFRVLGAFKWVCQWRRLWDEADCGASPISLNRLFFGLPRGLERTLGIVVVGGGEPAEEKDLPACGSALNRASHGREGRLADMVFHAFCISLGIGWGDTNMKQEVE